MVLLQAGSEKKEDVKKPELYPESRISEKRHSSRKNGRGRSTRQIDACLCVL